MTIRDNIDQLTDEMLQNVSGGGAVMMAATDKVRLAAGAYQLSSASTLTSVIQRPIAVQL